MCEHNALGYRSGLALCLTKVRSSRARCPATALISYVNIITPSVSIGTTERDNIIISHMSSKSAKFDLRH